jgi:hypothetical protein
MQSLEIPEFMYKPVPRLEITLPGYLAGVNAHGYNGKGGIFSCSVASSLSGSSTKPNFCLIRSYDTYRFTIGGFHNLHQDQDAVHPVTQESGAQGTADNNQKSGQVQIQSCISMDKETRKKQSRTDGKSDDISSGIL